MKHKFPIFKVAVEHVRAGALADRLRDKESRFSPSAFPAVMVIKEQMHFVFVVDRSCGSRSERDNSSSCRQQTPSLPSSPPPFKPQTYTYATHAQNTLFGDKSAAAPGGVRLGTPAMTTRGLDENDFRESVAGFLDRAACLACAAQERAGSKKLSAFVAEMEADEGVAELKREIEAFAEGFYFPGGAQGGGGDGR